MPSAQRLCPEKCSFLRRRVEAHKYDCGQVLLIAGSRGMVGAAVLTARAALRSGAGLVWAAVPRGIQQTVAAQLPEVITLALPETSDGSISQRAVAVLSEAWNRATVVAMGPGLTQQRATRLMVQQVIRTCPRPLVLDADALWSGTAACLKQRLTPECIITPHSGEMARLTGRQAAAVQKNRLALAKQFASTYNVVTVMKGAPTIIAAPTGAHSVNTTGNPGMATAGSGDVLTGIIAALIAQGAATAVAARAGVYIHGRAGDKARDAMGIIAMMATDIIAALPAVFKELYR